MNTILEIILSKVFNSFANIERRAYFIIILYSIRCIYYRKKHHRECIWKLLTVCLDKIVLYLDRKNSVFGQSYECILIWV